MRRTTITLPDDLYEGLCVEARRRDLSLSAVVREKIEAQLALRRKRLPGFVGIVDKQLPYSAADVDEELAKTFGRT